MRRYLSLWLPVIVVMTIIWNASALPSSPGPPGMPDWMVHGLAYALLALTAIRAFAGGGWAGVTAGSLAAAWLLATAFGGANEWHQMYVPGRTAEVRDFVANAVGALVAAAAAGAWGMIVRRS